MRNVQYIGRGFSTEGIPYGTVQRICLQYKWYTQRKYTWPCAAVQRLWRCLCVHMYMSGACTLDEIRALEAEPDLP